MSSHLSVATVIEKNRLASDIAFVLLLSVEVVDELGNIGETIYLARNSEAVFYAGNEYVAANFSVKLDLDVSSEPKLEVTADDPTGVLRQRMEDYAGAVGFPVTLTVVNTGNMTQTPEIQETFKVISSSAAGWMVTFTMGIDNPIAQRFPNRLQFQNQCSYLYKGTRCKYTGDLATCDFTYQGINGCVVHDNAANFGGFLGLQNLQG